MTRRVISARPYLWGHTDTVSNMSFNHDGSLLATGGLDGRAMIWSATDGSLQRTLEGPGGWAWQRLPTTAPRHLPRLRQSSTELHGIL